MTRPDAPPLRRMSDPRFTTAPRTHARYWRTSAQLSAAVIALAAKTPSTLITVGDIVQHAGVNRSTFYSHTENPTTLLNSAMGEALARADNPERRTVAVDRRIALHAALGPVVTHVTEHLAVYQTALTNAAAAGALFHGLTQHLTPRIHARCPALSEAAAAAMAAAASEMIAIGVAQNNVDLLKIMATLEAALGLQPSNWTTKAAPEENTTNGKENLSR